MSGPLSKDEIRHQMWWWQLPGSETTERHKDGLHEYDDSQEDVIATLGGYYEVPEDSHTPEAHELVELVHAELNPDE
ncbi:hypothetical protein ACWEN3_43245 [Streptomyces sp. NPDC004561]